MLVSSIQQHELAIRKHMFPSSWTSLPPFTPSHPSRLSLSPMLSSLHHTDYILIISVRPWLSNVAFLSERSLFESFDPFPYPLNDWKTFLNMCLDLMIFIWRECCLSHSLPWGVNKIIEVLSSWLAPKSISPE